MQEALAIRFSLKDRSKELRLKQIASGDEPLGSATQHGKPKMTSSWIKRLRFLVAALLAVVGGGKITSVLDHHLVLTQASSIQTLAVWHSSLLWTLLINLQGLTIAAIFTALYYRYRNRLSQCTSIVAVLLWGLMFAWSSVSLRVGVLTAMFATTAILFRREKGRRALLGVVSSAVLFGIVQMIGSTFALHYLLYTLRKSPISQAAISGHPSIEAVNIFMCTMLPAAIMFYWCNCLQKQPEPKFV